MRLRRIAALGILLAAAAPSPALVFNFTTIGGDSLTTDQASAFAAAANQWSSLLVDPITVNLAIGFRSLGSGILGGATPRFVEYDAATVFSALGRDARGADDAVAVTSLATATATRFALVTAQARALGLAAAFATDASIEFNTDYAFSTARAADGSIAADTFDLIGVAAHEIGHALGFVSNIDAAFAGDQTVLDQYRYTAPAARKTDAGAGYFSLNNGVTRIADFSTGAANDYQASHWRDGTSSSEVAGLMRDDVAALMDPAVAAGRTQNVTLLDVRALDVIGYDRAGPVPEPAGWATMVLGFGAIGALLRRRRRAEGAEPIAA